MHVENFPLKTLKNRISVRPTLKATLIAKVLLQLYSASLKLFSRLILVYLHLAYHRESPDS